MKRIILFLTLSLFPTIAQATPLTPAGFSDSNGVVTAVTPSTPFPITFPGGLSSGVYLGSSASVTNPQRNGDVTTGLFSSATSTVSIATGGISALTVGNDQGITLGSPTGGDKGSGTLNASNLYVNGTAVATGSLSAITLGTSASATNPQRSGQVTTGLFSASNSTVSIAAGGADVGDFGVNGLNLPNGTTALPSLTFGVANTGIYAPFSGTHLDMVVNGINGVGIDTSGSVFLAEPFGHDGVVITVGAATGNASYITAQGVDSVVALNIAGQAHGPVVFNDTSYTVLAQGNTAARFFCAPGNLRYNTTTLQPEGCWSSSQWNHVIQGSSGTPTCGTGCASITATSTDARGQLTSGTGVSSIVLNFSGTLATAPFCVCGGSATASLSCAATTSTLTIASLIAVTADKISWVCAE